MSMSIFSLLFGLIAWAVNILVIGAVAYLVIKKAVKDALREWDREKYNR